MAYFLRTTDANGKAYGGFQWPLQIGAVVTAPDWRDDGNCGHGLHGLLNGEGDSGHLSHKPDAIWWIVEADNAIDLSGKHKFKSCKVVAFGQRAEITKQIYELTKGEVHYLSLVGGDYSTLTGGDCSTLTGGDRSTLTGGDYSTLTGGDRSTLTGGDRSTLTGGYRSTLTGGYCSTLTGGDRSTLTGGNHSTLSFTKLDYKGVKRVLTGYVEEGGLKAGKAYRASQCFTQIVEVVE